METAEQVAPEQTAPEAPVEAEGQAVDTGQGEITAPEEGQAEPLYQYHFEDEDEPRIFATKDELDKFFRDHALRHRDYTKKTQSVAEQRKAIERERQKFDTEYQSFLQAKSRIDKYQEFLKQNPHVEKQLAQLMKQPRPQGDPRYDELKKELDSFKQERETEKQRQEREQAKEKAFELMSGRYQDFNRKEVEAMLEEFRETPPGGEAERLIELLYYANKGRKSPAQIEQEVAQRAEREKSAHTPMSPGKAGSGEPKTFSSIEEAWEAATKKYG